ncbi:hypothetical protein R6Q57_005815 [Mikania cordata]
MNLIDINLIPAIHLPKAKLGFLVHQFCEKNSPCEEVAAMIFCECGKEAVIMTSWTNKNPSCRFHGYPDHGSQCLFIGWFDQKSCQRCMDIIAGLLRAKNSLEGEKTNLQVQLKSKNVEARKLKKNLILSWIDFVLYIMLY